MRARSAVGCCLVVALMAMFPVAGRAAEAAPVVVGTTFSISDLPFFIAQSRGYFRDEGLNVKFVVFDSAARMIAPLASGDLDAASGGPSAALYNAIARGIGVRIVADKSSTLPGRHSQTLLVRKPLIESGRVKTLADLKGLKIASAAPGSSAMGTLNRIYKMTGLTSADFERVYMGFPQQIVALANGAVDVAFPTEPSATMAIRDGLGAKFMDDDEIYPNHQMSVQIYSDHFRRERADVGERFMRAYLRGVRAQNASIVNELIAGKDAEEFISLITENTAVKDRDLVRSINMSACDDDGRPNVASLKEDLDVFRAEGLIEGKVDVDDALDLSFVEQAARDLGPRAQ